MKRSIIFSLTILLSLQSFAQLSTADSLVSLMTLDEKLSLIGGKRMFYTNAVPRLGITPVLFADATQGVVLRPFFLYAGWKKPVEKSVAFPAPILLASAWDTALTARYARAIGEECRAANIGVLLGPGFNMYRISQCGRNFEYFGEDPFLTGAHISSFVKGVQSTGTIATLKHFVANNTDYYRRKSNSIVDERSMHELYLEPFRQGIDAGAKAVMTSYNLLNGEWCGQSSEVINGLLRDDLGFDGLVMTDWWSVYDGKKLVQSGQDLEMPSSKATKKAGEWIKQGMISEKEIDRMVSNQVNTFLSMNTYGREAYELPDSVWDQHEKIALETARKGIVLLKNERNMLPIDTIASPRILATGPYYDKNAYGTGAARVRGYDHVTLKDALESCLPSQVTYIKNPSPEKILSFDIVLVCAGTIDGEGRDRPFALPDDQQELIRRCVLHHPGTIVIMNSGSGVRMTDWHERAAAIVYNWYSGQNGAMALAEIITGKTNPSGKLPVTIEKDFKDSPGFGYIPEGEALYKGYKSSREKKREVYDIQYSERIYTGYRWYNVMGIRPLFPFGHGLSYTTFDYNFLDLSTRSFTSNDTLHIRFMLRNSGVYYGEEVVQLYLGYPGSSVTRPLKELKGFHRIPLKKGQEKLIEFSITTNELQYWSEESGGWTTESGPVLIMIGGSSEDIRLTGVVEFGG